MLLTTVFRKGLPKAVDQEAEMLVWGLNRAGERSMLRYRVMKNAVGRGQILGPPRSVHKSDLTRRELGTSSRIQTVGSRREGSFANQRLAKKGRNKLGGRG